MSENRMNCNLFISIKNGYFNKMIDYCNAFGWKYFWYDTFKIGKKC